MAKVGEAAGDPFLPQQQQQQPYYGVPVSAQQDHPRLYQHYQPFLLLPLYPGGRRRRRSVLPNCCACYDSLISSSSLLALLSALLLLAAAAFFLWPSQPEIGLVRLRLDHVRVSNKHKGTLVALDVALDLKIRVRNRDFFSLDYRSVSVSIGYRGRRLGSATTDGRGHVRARGVSYVDATLRLDGIRVLEDAFYLIEDIARGSIPFDTVTEVDGQLHFLAFDVPLEGRMSCAITVNVGNQTIAHQDCYPE